MAHVCILLQAGSARGGHPTTAGQVPFLPLEPEVWLFDHLPEIIFVAGSKPTVAACSGRSATAKQSRKETGLGIVCVCPVLGTVTVTCRLQGGIK
jgi:hypothetical protein